MGSEGSIDLTQVGVGAGGVSANPSLLNKPANLFLFNESGCLLTITFEQTGNGFKLPAGGWTLTPLPMGEYQINWSVDFLLGGAPINLLVGTYYAPGEPTPSTFSLGNSPIGGNVITGAATTITNQGNPIGTPVITLGDINFNQNFVLYNDGTCTWFVDASGVHHKVLGASNTAPFVTIGQAGDTPEVLGGLKVDQLLTAILGASITGGPVTITGNGVGTLHIGDNGTGSILDTTTATTYIKGPSGIVFQVPSGTTIATFSSTGLQMNSQPITCTRINLTQSGYDHLSQFTGGGSGSFGTGLSVAPSAIYTDPCTVSGSSQTIGFTIATTSVVTTGAGIAWQGQASH